MLCASGISLTPGPMPQIARPRLVATPAEDLGVRTIGQGTPAAKKEQPRPFGGRSYQGAASQGDQGQVKAKAAGGKAAEDDGEPEPPSRAARAADGFRGTRRAGGRSRHAGTRTRQPRLCHCCSARAGDGCCLFFGRGHGRDISGDPVAVMVLAATMEAGKLVIAGWLAAHWRRTNWKMRFVMVALVAGLALINAAGVFRQAGRGPCRRGGLLARWRHRAH